MRDDDTDIAWSDVRRWVWRELTMPRLSILAYVAYVVVSWIAIDGIPYVIRWLS